MLPKKEGAFIAIKSKFFFYIITNKIATNMKIFVHIDMKIFMHIDMIK